MTGARPRQGRAPTPAASASILVLTLRSVSAALEGLTERLRPAFTAAEASSGRRGPARGRAPGVSAPPPVVFSRPAAEADAPGPSARVSLPTAEGAPLAPPLVRARAASAHRGAPSPAPSAPRALPLVIPAPPRAAKEHETSRVPTVRGPGPAKWRAAARPARGAPAERGASTSSAQRARLPAELLAMLSEAPAPTPLPAPPRPSPAAPPVLERELVRALKTMTRSDAQAIELIKDIERRLAELRRFDALRRI
ncbi:MAG: hypothetical protein IPI35_27310 [Deltaproteobacteria bacterium]|nr:hypothetical protein [Deltaproteobacteria bacterium]